MCALCRNQMHKTFANIKEKTIIYILLTPISKISTISQLNPSNIKCRPDVNKKYPARPTQWSSGKKQIR